MTKEQPNGQNIRRYKYHTTTADAQPIVRRRRLSQREEVAEPLTRREQEISLTSTGRRVTKPQQVIQPISWAERRARRLRRPQEPPSQEHMVKRTFLQTGHAAQVGQRRMSRPLPRQHRAGRSVPKRRQPRGIARFWRRLFGFLAVLAVLGVGVSFALSSPTFHIQQVHITGTQNARLIATIEHMGIQGQDIFLLDQEGLITRLEALPLVASANLGMQLPNTVTVSIQERAPVLLWQSGQSTYGIGQDGVAIAPLNELSGSKALATVLDKRQQAARTQPGTRIDAAQIAFAQQLLQRLPAMQGVAPFTLQYVDRITVDGQTEPANQAGAGCYVVVSSQGWLAYMGDAVNSNPLENRLLELQQLLDSAQQEHVQLDTIDLRFGLRPTYTVKS